MTRLATLLSKRYKVSVEKALKSIETYRHCRDTWQQDWEGGLEWFRKHIRFALKVRRDYV